MTNTERIQANNAELREAIEMAEKLPDRTTETHPQYDGDYTVTPSTENEITLETAQKLMRADVKVQKIPYAEVSNDKGGKTVTIGGN